MKKSSLIIGRKPVLEALEEGKAIDKILLLKTSTGDIVQEIRRVAREKNVPIQVVPNEKLDNLSRVNHQGVIALTAIVQYYELQEVIDQVVGSGQVPLFLMLDGITDVRNIGGITRSAVCCGAQAIIIPDKGVGALNEEALKSSAGALEKIMISRVNSLMKAADTLRLNGIHVAGTAMKADTAVYDVNWNEPMCVILGSEDKGVYPPLLKICNSQLYIPMSGDFESFNVSVSAGIILYEAMKHRIFNAK